MIIFLHRNDDLFPKYDKIMPYPEFYLVLGFFPDFSGHSENLHISMGHCRKFSESTALLQTSNQYYNGPTNASMDSIRVAKP